MLNPYFLNIQESLKHAWFFEVLGSKSVKFVQKKKKFFVYERIKKFFLIKVTVGTNKMKCFLSYKVSL